MDESVSNNTPSEARVTVARAGARSVPLGKQFIGHAPASRAGFTYGQPAALSAVKRAPDHTTSISDADVRAATLTELAAADSQPIGAAFRNRSSTGARRSQHPETTSGAGIRGFLHSYSPLRDAAATLPGYSQEQPAASVHRALDLIHRGSSATGRRGRQQPRDDVRKVVNGRGGSISGSNEKRTKIHPAGNSFSASHAARTSSPPPGNAARQQHLPGALDAGSAASLAHSPASTTRPGSSLAAVSLPTTRPGWIRSSVRASSSPSPTRANGANRRAPSPSRVPLPELPTRNSVRSPVRIVEIQHARTTTTAGDGVLGYGVEAQSAIAQTSVTFSSPSAHSAARSPYDDNAGGGGGSVAATPAASVRGATYAQASEYRRMAVEAALGRASGRKQQRRSGGILLSEGSGGGEPISPSEVTSDASADALAGVHDGCYDDSDRAAAAARAGARSDNNSSSSSDGGGSSNKRPSVPSSRLTSPSGMLPLGSGSAAGAAGDGSLTSPSGGGGGGSGGGSSWKPFLTPWRGVTAAASTFSSPLSSSLLAGDASTNNADDFVDVLGPSLPAIPSDNHAGSSHISGSLMSIDSFRRLAVMSPGRTREALRAQFNHRAGAAGPDSSTLRARTAAAAAVGEGGVGGSLAATGRESSVRVRAAAAAAAAAIHSRSHVRGANTDTYGAGASLAGDSEDDGGDDDARSLPPEPRAQVMLLASPQYASTLNFRPAATTLSGPTPALLPTAAAAAAAAAPSSAATSTSALPAASAAVSSRLRGSRFDHDRLGLSSGPAGGSTFGAYQRAPPSLSTSISSFSSSSSSTSSSSSRRPAAAADVGMLADIRVKYGGASLLDALAAKAAAKWGGGDGAVVEGREGDEGGAQLLLLHALLQSSAHGGGDELMHMDTGRQLQSSAHGGGDDNDEAGRRHRLDDIESGVASVDRSSNSSGSGSVMRDNEALLIDDAAASGPEAVPAVSATADPILTGSDHITATADPIPAAADTAPAATVSVFADALPGVVASAHADEVILSGPALGSGPSSSTAASASSFAAASPEVDYCLKEAVASSNRVVSASPEIDSGAVVSEAVVSHPTPVPCIDAVTAYATAVLGLRVHTAAVSTAAPATSSLTSRDAMLADDTPSLPLSSSIEAIDDATPSTLPLASSTLPDYSSRPHLPLLGGDSSIGTLARPAHRLGRHSASLQREHVHEGPNTSRSAVVGVSTAATGVAVTSGAATAEVVADASAAIPTTVGTVAVTSAAVISSNRSSGDSADAITSDVALGVESSIVASAPAAVDIVDVVAAPTASSAAVIVRSDDEVSLFEEVEKELALLLHVRSSSPPRPSIPVSDYVHTAPVRWPSPPRPSATAAEPGDVNVDAALVGDGVAALTAAPSAAVVGVPSPVGVATTVLIAATSDAGASSAGTTTSSIFAPAELITTASSSEVEAEEEARLQGLSALSSAAAISGVLSAPSVFTAAELSSSSAATTTGEVAAAVIVVAAETGPSYEAYTSALAPPPSSSHSSSSSFAPTFPPILLPTSPRLLGSPPPGLLSSRSMASVGSTYSMSSSGARTALLTSPPPPPLPPPPALALTSTSVHAPTLPPPPELGGGRQSGGAGAHASASGVAVNRPAAQQSSSTLTTDVPTSTSGSVIRPLVQQQSTRALPNSFNQDQQRTSGIVVPQSVLAAATSVDANTTTTRITSGDAGPASLRVNHVPLVDADRATGRPASSQTGSPLPQRASALASAPPTRGRSVSAAAAPVSKLLVSSHASGAPSDATAATVPSLHRPGRRPPSIPRATTAAVAAATVAATADVAAAAGVMAVTSSAVKQATSTSTLAAAELTSSTFTANQTVLKSASAAVPTVNRVIADSVAASVSTARPSSAEGCDTVPQMPFAVVGRTIESHSGVGSITLPPTLSHSGVGSVTLPPTDSREDSEQSRRSFRPPPPAPPTPVIAGGIYVKGVGGIPAPVILSRQSAPADMKQQQQQQQPSSSIVAAAAAAASPPQLITPALQAALNAALVPVPPPTALNNALPVSSPSEQHFAPTVPRALSAGGPAAIAAKPLSAAAAADLLAAIRVSDSAAAADIRVSNGSVASIHSTSVTAAPHVPAPPQLLHASSNGVVAAAGAAVHHSGIPAVSSSSPPSLSAATVKPSPADAAITATLAAAAGSLPSGRSPPIDRHPHPHGLSSQHPSPGKHMSAIASDSSSGSSGSGSSSSCGSSIGSSHHHSHHRVTAITTYAGLCEQGWSPSEPDKPNQDCILMEEDTVPEVDEGATPAGRPFTEALLLSVFDGHGPDGHTIAQFCRDRLSARLFTHPAMLESVPLPPAVVVETPPSQVEVKPFPPAVGAPLPPKHATRGHTAASAAQHTRGRVLLPDGRGPAGRALADVLRGLEIEIQREGGLHGFDPSLSGCTACVCVIQGSRLTVANIGDSRAVLLRHTGDGASAPVPSNGSGNGPAAAAPLPNFNLSSSSGTSGASSPAFSALALTVDHKPTLPGETRRILLAGGRLEAIRYDDGSSGPVRVWLRDDDIPGLAMSRSLGDVVAKRAGVCADPDISVWELDAEGAANGGGSDAFLIVATDGLWEFMSATEVAGMVEAAHPPSAAVKPTSPPSEQGEGAATDAPAHASCLKASLEALADEAASRWTAREGAIDDLSIIIARVGLLPWEGDE